MTSQHCTNLCSSKHHSIEEDLEFLESELARTYHPVLLDGGQDLIIPETSLGSDKVSRKINMQAVRNHLRAASDCDRNL